MKSPLNIVHKAFLAAALVGLPLLGILCVGTPLGNYTEFPPLARYVGHAGFSWIAFTALAALIVVVVLPFVVRVLTAQTRTVDRTPVRNAESCYFPWWGWAGIALGVGFWIVAWKRFDWFAHLQIFTFTPQWVAYIVVVNALIHKRKGECMISQYPKYLAKLFVLSAVFWWYFEYLNRFVQNWCYTGIQFLAPSEYFIFATLPFSTVLPAVLSTYELLETFPRLGAGLDGFMPIRLRYRQSAGRVMLIVFGAGLFGIAVAPDYLFPLLWVAPLFVITALQAVLGKETIFSPIAQGKWRHICLLALASLICGVFWETWNYHSLAKWIYSVPFVDRFKIFEMPLLGYAGYLPFGLECAVVADLVIGERVAETGQELE